MPPLPALPPFEALVTAHGAAVLRLCRAMVGVGDAEDVWQETFIAALRAYPASAEVRNREAWLVAIAKNKAIDHHRRSGRLPIPSDPFGGSFGSPAGSPSGSLFTAAGDRGGPWRGDSAPHDGGDAVAQAVEARADATAVWAALAQLPPKQREAVVYHHLAGLRYAAVAELLGNSEAAARRSAADGMKALRALLGTRKGLNND